MHVTSSIGVAAQRAQHTSPVELVKRADEAMYLAKQQGRHTWTMAQMT
jgi:diguanylate cyclase (GGDEF)-like protein